MFRLSGASQSVSDGQSTEASSVFSAVFHTNIIDFRLENLLAAACAKVNCAAGLLIELIFEVSALHAGSKRLLFTVVPESIQDVLEDGRQGILLLLWQNLDGTGELIGGICCRGVPSFLGEIQSRTSLVVFTHSTRNQAFSLQTLDRLGCTCSRDRMIVGKCGKCA